MRQQRGTLKLEGNSVQGEFFSFGNHSVGSNRIGSIKKNDKLHEMITSKMYNGVSNTNNTRKESNDKRRATLVPQIPKRAIKIKLKEKAANPETLQRATTITQEEIQEELKRISSGLICPAKGDWDMDEEILPDQPIKNVRPPNKREGGKPPVVSIVNQVLMKENVKTTGTAYKKKRVNSEKNRQSSLVRGITLHEETKKVEEPLEFNRSSTIKKGPQESIQAKRHSLFVTTKGLKVPDNKTLQKITNLYSGKGEPEISKTLKINEKRQNVEINKRRSSHIPAQNKPPQSPITPNKLKENMSAWPLNLNIPKSDKNRKISTNSSNSSEMGRTPPSPNSTDVFTFSPLNAPTGTKKLSQFGISNSPLKSPIKLPLESVNPTTDNRRKSCITKIGKVLKETTATAINKKLENSLTPIIEVLSPIKRSKSPGRNKRDLSREESKTPNQQKRELNSGQLNLGQQRRKTMMVTDGKLLDNAIPNKKSNYLEVSGDAEAKNKGKRNSSMNITENVIHSSIPAKPTKKPTTTKKSCNKNIKKLEISPIIQDDLIYETIIPLIPKYYPALDIDIKCQMMKINNFDEFFIIARGKPVVLEYPKRPNLNGKSLILDLDNTLIFHEKDKCLPNMVRSSGTGILFAKRPEVIEFLESVHEHYEVIIYSAGVAPYVRDLAKELDPEGIYIDHVLTRDQCHNSGGDTLTKDLELVNREKKNIIIVDDQICAWPTDYNNVIPIRIYEGIDPPELGLLSSLARFIVALKPLSNTLAGLTCLLQLEHRKAAMSCRSSNISRMSYPDEEGSRKPLQPGGDKSPPSGWRPPTAPLDKAKSATNYNSTRVGSTKSRLLPPRVGSTRALKLTDEQKDEKKYEILKLRLPTYLREIDDYLKTDIIRLNNYEKLTYTGKTIELGEYPTRPKFTGKSLVIEMKGVFIAYHPNLTEGWKKLKCSQGCYKIRNGIPQFLKLLSSYYEIIILTTLTQDEGEEIIQEMDIGNWVDKILGREYCACVKDTNIKNLDIFLTRKSDKMIVIDTNVSFWPENVPNLFPVPVFTGRDPTDENLGALSKFLLAMKDIINPKKAFEKLLEFEKKKSSLLHCSSTTNVTNSQEKNPHIRIRETHNVAHLGWGGISLPMGDDSPSFMETPIDLGSPDSGSPYSPMPIISPTLHINPLPETNFSNMTNSTEIKPKSTEKKPKPTLGKARLSQFDISARKVLMDEKKLSFLKKKLPVYLREIDTDISCQMIRLNHFDTSLIQDRGTLVSLEYPTRPKLTGKSLILDLNDCLIYTNPDLETQLVTASGNYTYYPRANLNKFLKRMWEYYEIIIFSSGMDEYVREVCAEIGGNKLVNPEFPHCIDHVLGRTHCNGLETDMVTKELLTIVNRESKNMIIIDDQIPMWPMDLNNIVPIPVFDGKDEKDPQVFDQLIPLLLGMKDLYDVKMCIKELFDLEERREKMAKYGQVNN